MHSHLDSLPVPEQQVSTLKTENGFYYSYFAEVVQAPSLMPAIWGALRDERSEAPDVVNAVERFNIYQELVSGALFRAVRSVIGAELVGDPWNFFIFCIAVLNGAGHMALAALAGSVGGGGLRGGLIPGIILALVLFLHRSDFSRIQETGMFNLRENWALPFLWGQVLSLHRLLLTHPGMLRGGSTEGGSQFWLWSFRLCTVACIVLWQFSAFAFLLQVSAVFLCTLLSCDAGTRRALRDIIWSHLFSIAASLLLLCGNELLVHHMLVTQCLAIGAVLWFSPSPPQHRWLFWVDGVKAVLLFGVLRALQSPFATADEHVGELFKAKIRQIAPWLPGVPSEPSFNARLYLAVSVFDFIDVETLRTLHPSGVAAFAAVGALLWASAFVKWVLPGRASAGVVPAEAKGKGRKADDEDAKSDGAKDGELYAASFGYGVLLVQTLLFGVLGCFIARLKVLGWPLGCVLAATAAAPLAAECAAPGSGSGQARKGAGQLWRVALGVLVLVQGAQLSLTASHLPYIGDHAPRYTTDRTWSEGDSGELFDWMIRNIPANSTVLTSMSGSGSMRPHTPFKLVIHPQFESRSLRDRVQEIYQFYQCTPVEQFMKTMRKFGTTHLVIEYKRCDFSPFTLDDYPEVNCAKGERPWDELFCVRAHHSPHLKLLFANSGFALFSLRSTPKETQVPTGIEDPRAWRPYLKRCARDEGEVCGGRIQELATMWSSKLKKHKIAEILTQFIEKELPRDGHAQYELARHKDYDLDKPDQAYQHYKAAYEALPNNPIVVREYLMFLDLAVKDMKALVVLANSRRNSAPGILSLTELNDAHLACEAMPVALQTFKDAEWAEELWEIALQDGFGSTCVNNNWQIIRDKTMNDDIGKWGWFLHTFWHRGARSHLSSYASSGARWKGDHRRPWQLSTAAALAAHREDHREASASDPTDTLLPHNVEVLLAAGAGAVAGAAGIAFFTR